MSDIDLTPEERERFEERAGIIEFLANKPRWLAEKEAARQIRAERKEQLILEAK